MIATLVSFSGWMKVAKAAVIAVPIGFALWHSSSANRLKADLIEEQVKVEKLEAGILVSKATVEQYKNDSERLEISLNQLQASRQEVIDQRNNAWAVMDKYRRQKESFLASENLTPSEQDYAECQPIPVPDSRKPTS